MHGPVPYYRYGLHARPLAGPGWEATLLAAGTAAVAIIAALALAWVLWPKLAARRLTAETEKHLRERAEGLY